MPEIDKIKIDVSLIGWAAQNFTTAPISLLSTATLIIILVTLAIIIINRRAYRKIDELGDL